VGGKVVTRALYRSDIDGDRATFTPAA